MLTDLRLQNYPAIQFTTAKEWTEYFARASMPVRVEAGDRQGAIAWRMHCAALQHFRVAFGTHGSPVEIHYPGNAEGFQIHVPQAGSAEVSMAGRTILASPGQASLTDLSVPHRYRIKSPPAFKTISLILPKAVVEEHFSALGDRDMRGRVAFDLGLDLTTGMGAALASLADTLVTGLENELLSNAPIAIANLSQALLSLLAEAGAKPMGKTLPGPATSVTPRHVRRAIDFMRTHLDEPLTIVQIAEASQTSVRTLQSGFKEFRGTTPLAHLRQLRLEAAHAELVDPDSTLSVAEIAMKWGFAHFGRFSADYRAAFGQLPSATAKAARQN